VSTLARPGSSASSSTSSKARLGDRARSLDPKAATAALRSVKIRGVPSPFVPHDPLEPGKENVPQAAFLLLDDLVEAFYGGAAGGGKSDALLMAGLQYVDVPGYAGIIFRKTFTDLELPGGLIPRSFDWLGGTGARWVDRTHTWEFPRYGSSLSFGYMQTESDKYRYKSAEFQFVGFDELTQFTETQYRYLFSRARRPAVGPLSKVPIRIRGASNPGDVGHAWVKDRFLPKYVDRETGETLSTAAGLARLEEDPDSIEIVVPRDPETKQIRAFIPAKVRDNPHLDVEEYLENLRRLDHLEAARLAEGDWDATELGKLFGIGKVTILQATPLDVLVWCRFWDFAATDEKAGGDPDYTVGSLVGRRPGGEIVVGDIVRGRWSSATVEKIVRETSELDRSRLGRARYMVRMEREPGSAGKANVSHFVRHVLLGFDAKGEPATGEKSVRARAFSAQWDAENVYLVRGAWNAAFVEEAIAFPSAGVHDDQVDATVGAFEAVAGYRRRMRALGAGGPSR